MNIIEELLLNKVPFELVEEDEDTHVRIYGVDILFTTQNNYAIFYKGDYVGVLEKNQIGQFIKKLKKGGD